MIGWIYLYILYVYASSPAVSWWTQSRLIYKSAGKINLLSICFFCNLIEYLKYIAYQLQYFINNNIGIILYQFVTGSISTKMNKRWRVPISFELSQHPVLEIYSFGFINFELALMPSQKFGSWDKSYLKSKVISDWNTLH